MKLQPGEYDNEWILSSSLERVGKILVYEHRAEIHIDTKKVRNFDVATFSGENARIYVCLRGEGRK